MAERHISKSVGAWEQGAVNLKGDVIIIQELLTAVFLSTGKKQYSPGKIDGGIARLPRKSTTLAAIIAFEANYLSMCSGLIESNSKTMRRLNEEARVKPGFPPQPNFKTLSDNDKRAEIFGKFAYEPAPTDDNPEAIKILGDWEKKNIVTVELPQLAKVTGGKYKRMRFHHLAQKQLIGLWNAWGVAGLLDRILTYDGSFVPRFVRGSTTVLSNHSFGSAFDINYEWNKRKHIPAQIGQIGCVRELVPLANEYGFYWGGHYSSRPDGMHFEVAILAK